MIRSALAVLACAMVCAVALTGCDQGASSPAASGTPTASRASGSAASSASGSAVPSASESAVLALPTTGVADYQLGASYDTVLVDGVETALDVVVRDVGSVPLEGAYSVCYVNGFQTQPDDAAVWLAHPELLLADDDGDPVPDPDWPDEYVLDPTTAAQREGILERIGPLIDQCAAKGFDAIEIDNLDTWTRFSAIDEASAVALATSYVERAHAAGLAAAQKNTAELGSVGRDEVGFDFAIAEECAVWDECGIYLDIYDGRVLAIEYTDAWDEADAGFAAACEADPRPGLLILRDRDLVGQQSREYVYDRC
ncbi:endo alpha-1,4 polygalactosaminidase [Demequina sp. NBRC 110054]|uniref:endo alpha-1,4 polygalactosaminidase n=1 Tax=Demequina sp. NBRC 110054 TaxID=1570343 RepID=UPI000A06620D|nr:endo alpha-1,4 polygalactosaminidase [Demequina sp. NBRC 110054]